MDKLWSKTEITHLRRNASKQTIDELAQRFQTDSDTVRQKLAELGLTSESGSDQTNAELDAFGKGVQALHDGKAKEAAKIFSDLIDSTDSRQLRDRAGQYLGMCETQLSKGAGDGDQDPYLLAVFDKNAGHLDQAVDRCKKAGKTSDDERWAYLAASIHALREDADQALEHLERAVALEPKNRVHAFHDPDFELLRADERFSGLIKLAPAQA